MKLKLLPALAAVCCTLALVFAIQACRKTDWKYNKQNNLFDVKAAKEWWYGNFRKTSDYRAVDFSSLFAPDANNGDVATRKYPSWKRGISYTIGNLQVAELPLIYNSPVSIFPGSGLLSKEEKIRIAKASLSKLLLFKKSTGSIVVRTVTLVPSPAYAKQKNYDITSNTLQNPNHDFNGWLIIKDWKETLISYWQIENGKRVKKLVIEKKQIQPKQSGGKEVITEQEVCVPAMVERTGRLCVGEVINADEPGEPDECTDWYDYSYWDLEFRCDDIGGPGEDDPMEVCMSMGLSTEQCTCIWYGLGCEEQGGGYTPPLPIVINDVTNPCMRSSVENAINSDVRNKVSQKINEVWQNSDKLHLQFNNGTLPAAQSHLDARTSTFLPTPNLEQLKSVITLNDIQLQHASKEYIAVTILHEVIHAWIEFKYPAPLDNAQQHELIASSNRFNMIRDALMAMFPSLGIDDATDLTWGGLGHTIAFTNKNQAEKERINNKNLDYKDQTRATKKGTPC